MSSRRRTQSSSEDYNNLEGRVRRPSKLRTVRESPASSSYSLRTVIFICLFVSILCHFLLPIISSHIEHIFKSTFHRRKVVTYHGNVGGLISSQETAENAPAIRKPTFLVDPIYETRWNVQEVYTAVPVEVDKNDPAKIKEALAAARAARKSRKDGNVERAMTIIKHAIALAPNNPDILIEMGQVQELNNEMVEADQCYVKALAFDPKHTEAVELRAKTSPIVRAIDRKLLKSVHDLRDEFAHLQHTTALRKMMRETYFLYVYHTVAIEGNTLDLGQTRAILESGMVVPGKSIREHNEVIGMDAALRFLNSSLLSREHDMITVDDILEMHKRVLGNADPIEAGKLRNSQVYVGKFTPIAPEYVFDQMVELAAWLNDENTNRMDPIEKAAIAHYKLVLVHPFTDGNGRTARLLLNLIMMRSGFPPVILPVETRAEYYASLHVANLGDLRPFVRYVAKHAKNSINRYISEMKTSANCIGKENAELEETGYEKECKNEQ